MRITADHQRGGGIGIACWSAELTRGGGAWPSPLAPGHYCGPSGQVVHELLASAPSMDQLPPAFDFGPFAPPAAGSEPAGGGTAFDSAAYGAAAQHGGAAGVDAGLSQDDLAWLEAQLSLAAQHASPPPPPPTSFAPLASPNGTETYVHQPHAFPPVSSSKYHPYSLPPDRARRIRPPGPSAHLNLVQPHLHQPAHQHQPPYQHQQHQHYQAPNAYSTAPAQSGLDALQWPSFSSFASSFAPVAAPPAPSAHYGHSSASYHAAPAAKQLGSVLYPPQDAPSPVLLPDAPTPTYPAAPHASPATPSTLPHTQTSPLPSPPLVNGHSKSAAWPSSAVPNGDARPRPRRPRARSAPPAPAPPSSFPRTAASPSTPPRARPRKAQQLSELFAWLDAQRWTFATLFSALSDLEGSPAEHERRLGEFLEMDEPLSAAVDEGDEPSDGARLLREAKRRWAVKRRQDKGKGREGGGVGGGGDDDEVEERGPDEVVRMWEEQGGLGRRREGTMVRSFVGLFVTRRAFTDSRPSLQAKAVRELHSNVHDGAVAGSVRPPLPPSPSSPRCCSSSPSGAQVIRRIINRYGEAYKESSTDIEVRRARRRSALGPLADPDLPPSSPAAPRRCSHAPALAAPHISTSRGRRLDGHARPAADASRRPPGLAHEPGTPKPGRQDRP